MTYVHVFSPYNLLDLYPTILRGRYGNRVRIQECQPVLLLSQDTLDRNELLGIIIALAAPPIWLAGRGHWALEKRQRSENE